METIKEKIGMNVCFELKNGSKYFGKFKAIDDTPKNFSWYILEKNNKEQSFSDDEIRRVEVLD